MATVTYTFVRRCDGGGHFVVDVALNSSTVGQFSYTTDEIRAPLSALTEAEREAAALLVLKIHLAGKTRAQIVSEFQAGPVTVTI